MYQRQLLEALENCRHRKLCERVSRLSTVLNQFPRELAIHQRVNAFYYMQKMEEMRLLEGSVAEYGARIVSLLEIMDATYNEVVIQWKGDVRWINRHLTHQRSARPPEERWTL